MLSQTNKLCPKNFMNCNNNHEFAFNFTEAGCLYIGVNYKMPV